MYKLTLFRARQIKSSENVTKGCDNITQKSRPATQTHKTDKKQTQYKTDRNTKNINDDPAAPATLGQGISVRGQIKSIYEKIGRKQVGLHQRKRK